MCGDWLTQYLHEHGNECRYSTTSSERADPTARCVLQIPAPVFLFSRVEPILHQNCPILHAYCPWALSMPTQVWRSSEDAMFSNETTSIASARTYLILH